MALVDQAHLGLLYLEQVELAEPLHPELAELEAQREPLVEPSHLELVELEVQLEPLVEPELLAELVAQAEQVQQVQLADQHAL